MKLNRRAFIGTVVGAAVAQALPAPERKVYYPRDVNFVISNLRESFDCAPFTSVVFESHGIGTWKIVSALKSKREA